MTLATDRKLMCLHYIPLENGKIKCDLPRNHKGRHEVYF